MNATSSLSSTPSFLSTPSLGITHLDIGHFFSSLFEGLPRDDFQLPLSGSQKISHEFGTISSILFQLPLSGSQIVAFDVEDAAFLDTFQLPLSGSRLRLCLGRIPDLSPFNSLSRDHMAGTQRATGII
jgi:hypothetical protein